MHVSVRSNRTVTALRIAARCDRNKLFVWGIRTGAAIIHNSFIYIYLHIISFIMSSTTNSRACLADDQDETDGDHGTLPAASSTNRSTSRMDNVGGPLVIDLVTSSAPLKKESQGGLSNRSTSRMDNVGGPLVIDLVTSSAPLKKESQYVHELNEYDVVVVKGKQDQNKHYKAALAAVFPEYNVPGTGVKARLMKSLLRQKVISTVNGHGGR
jgi:hypothetical protein